MMAENPKVENKDFAAEFKVLIESAIELDEKSKRELLNRILSSGEPLVNSSSD